MGERELLYIKLRQGYQVMCSKIDDIYDGNWDDFRYYSFSENLNKCSDFNDESEKFQLLNFDMSAYIPLKMLDRYLSEAINDDGEIERFKTFLDEVPYFSYFLENDRAFLSNLSEEINDKIDEKIGGYVFRIRRLL